MEERVVREEGQDEEYPANERNGKRKAGQAVGAVKRGSGKENSNTVDPNVRLIVRPVMGPPLLIAMLPGAKLGELRMRIARQLKLDPSILTISTSHDGFILAEDERTLLELGVTDGMKVDVTVPVHSGMATPTQKEPAQLVVMMVSEEKAEEGSGAEGKTRIIVLGPVKVKVAEDSPRARSLIQEDLIKAEADVEGLSELSTALNLRDASGGSPSLPTQAGDSTISTSGADIFKPSPSMPATASCCHACGIRLRLAMRFTCKCGQVFCATHRYHDQHDCNFDYRGRDLARLAATLPACLPSRIR